MEHLTEQDLVQLALDNTTASTDIGADVWEHLQACEHCSGEIASYRTVLALGRESDAERGLAPPPPPAVWAAIARELSLTDLTAPEVRQPGRTDAPTLDSAERGRPHNSTRRRTWLLAAAAIIAVFALGAGVLIGRATMHPAPAASATTSAALTPVTPDSTKATGTATIITGTQGVSLTVVTDHLPLRQGFYQVWLYDQDANTMVPIGTLNGHGDGTFTVTPSIDINAFNVVDISAQELNGNPAHGTSVLRGTLTQ